MAATTKKPRRLVKALVETAAGMHNAGILGRKTYDKITMRHLDPDDLPRIAPGTASQIRVMRERTNMSQAVFASCLNVTTGYVSQLERGAMQQTGAALALLNVIKRKGIAAIL